MTILWAGGEDVDFLNVGASPVVTTAGHFRSGYARCTLRVLSTNNTPIYASYFRSGNIFSASNFWLGFRHWTDAGGGGGPANAHWIRFLDATGVVRLRVRGTAGGIAPVVVEKVNAAGTATQLGSNSTSNPLVSAVQKIDMHINDAVSGSFDLYFDGTNVLSYTGDLTTDGVSTLVGFDLGANTSPGFSPAGGSEFSELIVADQDTRPLALVTCQPNGAGASSQWTGTAAGTTVNEITLNDADGIDSGTTNFVSLFTQPGTIPANINYSILGVVVSARALTVAAQPQHLDLSIRQGGVVYNSADKNLTTAFAPYQNIWATNPNSAAAWTAADLTTTQIGVRSVT